MIKKIRKFFEETLLLKSSSLILVGDYGYFANGIMFHSGRTDNQDGHNQYATNTYHYHHGYPAHNHENNKCPYLPITLWHNENYHTFHSKLTNKVSIDLYDKDNNFIKSYVGNKVYTGSGLNGRGDLIALTIDTIKDIYYKLSISKYNLQSLDNYCSLESFIDGDCNFMYNFNDNKIVLKQYYITKTNFKNLGWSTNIKYLNNNIVEEFNNMFKEYNIVQPIQITHFLAQIMEESDNWYHPGKGDGLIEVGGKNDDPEYYNDDFEEKYGGRLDLGNENPGDGSLFRGAGYIQLTGRYNYTKFYEYMKSKGDDNPLILRDGYKEVSKNYSLKCAVWFWCVLNNINDLSLTEGEVVTKNIKIGDEFVDITGPSSVFDISHTVNGGYTAIQNRIKFFYMAKEVLKA